MSLQESKIKNLIPLLLSLALFSCINQKHFLKGDKIYIIKPGQEGSDPIVNGLSAQRYNDTLFVYTLKKGFLGTMKENEGYITIKPCAGCKLDFGPADSVELIPPKSEHAVVAWWARIIQVKGPYFFPNNIKDTFPADIIRFIDSKPILQALTIPIRIRPKLTTPALKDSFPSQVETGVNAGIAFGWKFNYHFYKPVANSFGQKGNTISFTPALFYGISGTSLTKANTRNPVITFERKAVSNTVGFFWMVGFNSFNLGYAIGWDFATGPGSSTWLYQGHLWHGIAFSLDLIK